MNSTLSVPNICTTLLDDIVLSYLDSFSLSLLKVACSKNNEQKVQDIYNTRASLCHAAMYNNWLLMARVLDGSKFVDERLAKFHVWKKINTSQANQILRGLVDGMSAKVSIHPSHIYVQSICDILTLTKNPALAKMVHIKSLVAGEWHTAKTLCDNGFINLKKNKIDYMMRSAYLSKDLNTITHAWKYYWHHAKRSDKFPKFCNYNLFFANLPILHYTLNCFIANNIRFKRQILLRCAISTCNVKMFRVVANKFFKKDRRTFDNFDILIDLFHAPAEPAKVCEMLKHVFTHLPQMRYAEWMDTALIEVYSLGRLDVVKYLEREINFTVREQFYWSKEIADVLIQCAHTDCLAHLIKEVEIVRTTQWRQWMKYKVNFYWPTNSPQRYALMQEIKKLN